MGTKAIRAAGAIKAIYDQYFLAWHVARSGIHIAWAAFYKWVGTVGNQGRKFEMVHCTLRWHHKLLSADANRCGGRC